MLAVSIALIWTLIDRKRTNYQKLHQWLRVYVRFTLAAAKDTGINKPDAGTTGPSSVATPVEELPAHVIRAQKCLEDLEKRDPKTVHEAKRFFILK